MYQNIRLNAGYWKKVFPFSKFMVPNPLDAFSDNEKKFSQAMKAFRMDKVNKNTRSSRHSATQLYLKDLIKNTTYSPVIIDIGASSGITSLELMELIDNRYKKYYVTDYHIKCSYQTQNPYTYFFNNSGVCFLVASEKFVFYPRNQRLFDLKFKKRIDELKENSRNELLLIDKSLQKRKDADARIAILPYNIFESWQSEKADIIIAGNLLNEVYFTKEQIKKAISNCYNALSSEGLFVVIRNASNKAGKEVEKSSIYRKDSSKRNFKKIEEINGGVEINNFLLSLDFPE